MIYIHDNQPASEIMNISNRYCSGISIYMTNYNLIITTIYRPPDCPQAFIGDFNFPRLHWPNGKLTPGGTQSEQEQAKYLIKLMDTLFLNQFILKPTRGNNTLDLALSNNELLIHDYLSTPTTFSDHNILDITLNYNQQRIPTDNSNESKTPLSKFNYSNADCDQLNHALKKLNHNSKKQLQQ